MNERFRLQADKSFTFLFPSGFLLALAYMLFQWRWALGVSIILLQATIAALIFFTTQNSMVRLAKAVEAKNADDFDTRPVAGIIFATAVNILLVLAGVAMAALIEWIPPSR